MKWILCYILLFTPFVQSQNQESIRRVIAFYNLENLFDTIDNPETFDDDFTPKGRNSYTSEDYQKKLGNLASVIQQIGPRLNDSGPDILGVAEVENRSVLEDLLSVPGLDSVNYAILHTDSPDRRGIDVALIYREDIFFPIDFDSQEVRIWNPDGNRIYTRDVLWVNGILDGEEIHILVNHWPSRRGGSSRSAPKRAKAALVNKTIIEAIRSENPVAKILIMGDFNDDPLDRSLKHVLGSCNLKNLDSSGFYNPMIQFSKMGFNTLVYRDQIHLFDQILLSPSFMNRHDKEGFKFDKAGIFNPPDLSVKEGKYRGYPKRSFQNGKYSGGFSDHFPVFIELTKD